jgi:hypothetical protein
MFNMIKRYVNRLVALELEVEELKKLINKLYEESHPVTMGAKGK